MTSLRLLSLVCNSLNLTQIEGMLGQVVADVAKLDIDRLSPDQLTQFLDHL